MINVILNFLYIMGTGVLAMLFVVLVKINDLTELNPNLNFGQVFKVFMRKAKVSYLISLTGLLMYSILRKQIMGVFVSGDSSGIVNRLFAAQLLMATMVGGGLQWGVYKFAFKKLDNIMKIWAGDAKSGGPDQNTTLVTPQIDGTIEQPQKNP